MLAFAPAIGGFATPLAGPPTRTTVSLPAHIKHLGSLNSSEAQLVPVIFQVKPRNVEKLFELATAVSTPSDSRYGQHLSAADVAELTAPSPEDVKAVAEWLQPAAVSLVADNAQGLVRASLNTTKAAALLHTTFRRLECSVSSLRFVRAGNYSLPAHIAALLASVTGLHGLPLPKKPLLPTRSSEASSVTSEARASADCGGESGDDCPVTPALLKAQYQITHEARAGSHSRLGVVEFSASEKMSADDLATFVKASLPSRFAHASVAKFHGDACPVLPSTWSSQSCTECGGIWLAQEHECLYGPGQGGGEAMLDVEYLIGVAPGLATEFYYYAKGDDFCGNVKRWTSAILGSAADAPRVHSVSYGWQGDLSNLNCDAASVDAVDVDLAKLAAMGFSIIVSSGDAGSGYDDSDGILYSSWPASSPWVTAVGATRLTDVAPGPETAVDTFGSGGGFYANATRFPQPKYQKKAVDGYFHVMGGASSPYSMPPQRMYNRHGRATPDVSLLGQNYQVVVGGSWQGIGGTSASAPAFAAMVALLNDAREAAGAPPMGFLNPFIYSNPQAFEDVVSGDNSQGRSPYSPNSYFWLCAAGWDPVTGLGSAHFPALLKAALAYKNPPSPPPMPPSPPPSSPPPMPSSPPPSSPPSPPMPPSPPSSPPSPPSLPPPLLPPPVPPPPTCYGPIFNTCYPPSPPWNDPDSWWDYMDSTERFLFIFGISVAVLSLALRIVLVYCRTKAVQTARNQAAVRNRGAGSLAAPLAPGVPVACAANGAAPVVQSAATTVNGLTVAPLSALPVATPVAMPVATPAAGRAPGGRTSGGA